VPQLLIMAQEEKGRNHSFKENIMIHWTEHNWDYSLVNPLSLPCMSEISGAVHLAQLGLTAGRQTGRQACK